MVKEDKIDQQFSLTVAQREWNGLSAFTTDAHLADSIRRTSGASSPVSSHCTNDAGTSPTASKASMYSRMLNRSPNCRLRIISVWSSMSFPMT